jgi:hypothetical protein
MPVVLPVCLEKSTRTVFLALTTALPTLARIASDW